jgi:hypothetical protein
MLPIIIVGSPLPVQPPTAVPPIQVAHELPALRYVVDFDSPNQRISAILRRVARATGRKAPTPEMPAYEVLTERQRNIQGRLVDPQAEWAREQIRQETLVGQ